MILALCLLIERMSLVEKYINFFFVDDSISSRFLYLVMVNHKRVQEIEHLVWQVYQQIR